MILFFYWECIGEATNEKKFVADLSIKSTMIRCLLQLSIM